MSPDPVDLSGLVLEYADETVFTRFDEVDRVFSLRSSLSSSLRVRERMRMVIARSSIVFGGRVGVR